MNRIAPDGDDDRTDQAEAAPPPLAEKAKRLLNRAFLVGFGAVWLAVVGGIFGMMVWHWLGELRPAVRYRPVAATVTAYTPAKEVPSDGAKEEVDAQPEPAEIEYTYQVDGQDYRGKHKVERRGPGPSETGDALARPHAAGKSLTAYYDPDAPADSTLDLTVDSTPIGFIIFVSPFVVLGVVLILTGLFGDPESLRHAMRPSGRTGRRGAVPMPGGLYMLFYFVFSAVAAFGFFGIAMAIRWQRAVWIGLGLWIVVVPAMTLLVGAKISRWLRRRSARSSARRLVVEVASVASATAAMARPGKKIAVMAAVTVFWCGITGVFAGIAAYGLYKQADARGRYIATTGTVTAARVEVDHDEDGTTYTPKIDYRYTVGGAEYHGHRYCYGMMGSSDRDRAETIVEACRQPGPITVYYDPADPAESVLVLQTDPSLYFMILFLQPFIVVGVGLAAYTLSIAPRLRRARRFLAEPVRTPWTIPGWGTLSEEMSGLTIRARSRWFLVGAALGIGHAVPCLAATLAMAFLIGPHRVMPWQVAAAVGGSAGVGLLAGATVLLRRRARLHVDSQLKRLTLAGGKSDADLTFDRIARWRLTRSKHAATWQIGRKTTIIYAPLLSIETAEGQTVDVHRFWPSEPAWLVAAKAGEALARMTGKDFQSTESPAARPERPGSDDE